MASEKATSTSFSYIATNPTTGVVYIEGAHEWRVETIFGAHLIQGREKRIDLSAFAKGVYIVKADNNTIVKLVKE